MKYILRYTKHAKKDLEILNKSDIKRIILKLEYFLDNDPMSFSKPLTGQLKGLFRFRIGDYRVIFHRNSKGKITILTILKIKHRKDIYG